MSISSKIIKEINCLDVDEEMRKLLLDFLNCEDKGVHHYKNEYKAIAKKYIDLNKADKEYECNN